MPTDTYSLTFDLGYELPFRRVTYDLTYYILCSMPFEGFEDGLDNWPLYSSWTYTYVSDDLSSATMSWDTTTEPHSGTYAGRLYTDSIASPGGYAESGIGTIRGITNDFNTIGFWYKINITYGYDAEFYAVVAYIDEYGYEQFVELCYIYNGTTCDWTYIEVNLNTIDIGTGSWGQIVPILFAVYTWAYADTESELEVLIDDITTRICESSQLDLEYNIRSVVAKEVTHSLKYCVPIDVSPIELGLEYDTQLPWCNGGFELGDLTCWDSNTLGGTYDTAEINVTTDAKYTGTYGCQLLNEHDDDYSTYGQLWLRQEYLADNWNVVTFRYKVNTDTYTVSARFWVTLSFIIEYEGDEYENEIPILDITDPVAGSWIDVSISRGGIDLGEGYWGTTTKIKFRQRLGEEPS
jgi:hypothetical protein